MNVTADRTAADGAELDARGVAGIRQGSRRRVRVSTVRIRDENHRYIALPKHSPTEVA